MKHRRMLMIAGLTVVTLTWIAGWANFGRGDDVRAQVLRPMTVTPVKDVISNGAMPFPQAQAAPISGDLRWVRGTVLSLSTDSLTVKLRERAIAVTLDATTQVISSANGAQSQSLSLGAVVEVHYINRHGVQRAVLIFKDLVTSPKSLSKRPGTSYLGVVKTTKPNSRSLTIRIDGQTRRIVLNSHATLVDRTGHALATGSKAIAQLLSLGESLLVTYRTDWYFFPVGDVNIWYYSKTALEIRRL